MRNKLTSRKFWVAIAAGLCGVGAGVSGLVIGDHDLTKGGLLLIALGSGIYAAAEAYVDGKSVASTTTVSSTETKVTANASGNAAASVVDAVLPKPTDKEVA